MFNNETAQAIVAAADKSGIGRAELLALVEVETGGTPFEADGRTPRFLFERHKAYQQAKAVGTKTLNAFVRAGLAIPKWNRATQYKDQGKSAQRLALMAKACRINEEVAKRSASWGLGQTMGFLAESLGFNSATEMVAFQTGNVSAQLDCMIRELKRAGIAKALNAHNWQRVARLYNGPGYAQNRYDVRMHDAYVRWSRKLPQLDKPAPPEQSLAQDEIEDIQRKLRDLGFMEVGAIDGKWGSRTTGAISAFQAHQGLPVNGHFDKATQEALEHAELPREAAPERSTVTADDLREMGSDTIKHADSVSWLGRLKQWLGIGVVGGAVTEQAGWLDKAQDAAYKAQQVSSVWDSFRDFVAPFLKYLNSPAVLIIGILLVASGFACVYIAKRIRENRVADHVSGVHAGPET